MKRPKRSELPPPNTLCRLKWAPGHSGQGDIRFRFALPEGIVYSNPSRGTLEFASWEELAAIEPMPSESGRSGTTWG